MTNHIIILENGYFPENLKTAEGDTVTLFAPADGVIPVSVYTNDCFKRMNVEVIPGSVSGQELYMYCAFRIGQISIKTDSFIVYTASEPLKLAIEGNHTGKSTKKSRKVAKEVVNIILGG